MSRPLGPYEERRMLPPSDDLETWPRPREYYWAALAVALAFYAGVVGPLDMQAEEVTAAIVEEEVARRAAADGVPPISLFAADPRELHRLDLGFPLACLPPQGQWLWKYGDGRAPYEPHPVTRERAFQCVNADLRRKIHVP